METRLWKEDKNAHRAGRDNNHLQLHVRKSIVDMEITVFAANRKKKQKQWEEE